MIVYRHRRLDTNEVFYTGIAKKPSRPYSKSSRNSHWKNIVNKTDYSVELLSEVETWDDACELEMLLIKEYGRKDLGLGNLVNMTDGGDGSFGVIVSDETKEKLSKLGKGRIVTAETRVKIANTLRGKPSGMSGKKMSDEHKRKIGEANKLSLKGKTLSEDHKNNIKEGMKKNK